MIARVYERALSAQLGEVVVATDDERIFRHVEAFGGRVFMTAADHQSGTDRCAEVALQFADFEYIINIQGDEPFITPKQIHLALAVFENNPLVQISTLVKRVGAAEELFNPNVVKAVVAHDGRALYFSRQPVPFLRGLPNDQWLAEQKHFKHIGLYAYRRDTLLEIAKLPPSPLECAESLEQLRWLESGFYIGTAQTQEESIGIDTPDDLAKAVTLFL